jgi:co-chaperonin GroES (HSP10)
MSERKRKGEDDWESMLPTRGADGIRVVRRINPMGLRVLVRVQKEENVTEAGLFLPEGAKEAMNESLLCEVTEVASAVDDDTKEEANISGIPLGSKVLIPKKAGVRVPWDDTLRIVDTKEVLAVVFEVNLV